MPSMMWGFPHGLKMFEEGTAVNLSPPKTPKDHYHLRETLAEIWQDYLVLTSNHAQN